MANKKVEMRTPLIALVCFFLSNKWKGKRLKQKRDYRKLDADKLRF